jgi:hypothetical protein
MHRQAAFFLSFPLLFCLFIGCTSGGRVQYSNPSLIKTAAGDLQANGILHLNDISISIRPQNDYINVGATGFIVPVIPQKNSRSQDNSLELFDIVIQLEAMSEDCSFDPSKVLLALGDTQYAPTVTMGPFMGDTRIVPTEKPMPGHSWQCSALSEGTASILTSIEGSINPGNVFVSGQKCFVLRYPVFTPEPSQDFYIIVNGLAENNTELAVPMVAFTQSSRLYIQ